jgi:nitroreductase
VNLVDNKKKIDDILMIQGGLKGYSEKLSQLIVLTSDRNYFYSIGERYQLYIDGGIYLMNLLYALHYYEIAACPAHWGMPIESDKKVEKILGLNESEKIICLIAIGKPVAEFKTTLSTRRTCAENLHLVN